jgi:hypothetical protein
MILHVKIRVISLIGLFFCIILLAACSGANKVTLRNYTPEFTAGLDDYKGKRVYLMNFDNQAWDTTTFQYYSPDKDFTYTGDSLIHNYFWYAFEKAFVKLGMSVTSQDKPDPNAPAMWLTLKSITDDKYEVEVKINKRENLVFKKIYTVVGDPVQKADRSRGYLENRAYLMTNRLIQAILMDPAFKAVFFKTTAELATSPSR